MKPWTWVARGVAIAVHEEQIVEHGGGAGLRDAGLLDSALARPQNLAAYGNPDIADLAAAYGYGLARNHPFVDGNKRTVAVVLELFLELNGHELTASDESEVLAILALASGTLVEKELADWIRANSRRPKG